LKRRSKQKKTASNKLVRKHEQAQLQPQGPKLVNLSQTTTSNNRQTNEQATTTEPVNNISISNDYQTAAEAQKEPETYDEHASRNKQTFLLANNKH
jgi:hypothetical protein